MADTTIMRRNNLQLVLESIAGTGEVTAAELVRQTGLSVATISRVLTQLRLKGLILQDRKAETELGRKPETCRINGAFGSSLYLNLKSGLLQGYLLDFRGRVRGETETPVSQALTVAQFLELAAAQLAQLTASASGPVLAVCLSVPGQLDRRSGTVCRIPNFPHFEQAALGQRLQQRLGLPCYIRNTARLTAWGCCQPKTEQPRNLIYVDITADGGIGAGLVIGGRLYEDPAGHVGEMGDMIVSLRPYDQAQMRSRGALEQEAGLNTVLRRAGVSSLKQLEEAAQQDETAAGLLESATRAWAAAIVNLVAVLSPDEVILGGDLSEENHVIEALLRRHLSELYYRGICLRLTEPDSRRHVRGAAALLQQKLFAEALDDINR